MSKKRKTREEKIKSEARRTHPPISYTLETTELKKAPLRPRITQEAAFEVQDVKRIGFATLAILALNLILFLLLITDTIHLGLLGY